MKINIGYVWNELLKALGAKRESEDAEALAWTEKRIAQWRDVLLGIQNG